MADVSLRILVVLPMYGGSLPIGRYCVEALRDLGHSVQVFDAPRLYPAFTGLKELGLPPMSTGPLENSLLQVVGQAVWTQVECLRPDLVLALAQAPLNRLLLQRLKRAGIRTAMWFVEDYAVFDYWRAYAPLYDVFAVIQKEPFTSLLREVGQPRAPYLPLAALPSFHRMPELTPEERAEYGAEAAFLGAGYPNRRQAFRALADRDFKIWGSDWDGETVLAPHIQRGGARISPEESVKIYAATAVNINLHSSVFADRLISGGDFVNPRTFELACMGAFQLVDRRQLLPELFAEDELAVFDSMPQCLELLDHFAAHPEERADYARRAQARVLRDHTYQQRMRALLSCMEEQLGPWPGSGRPVSALESVPESLRAALPPLLRQLGLPPEARFDDLTAALRALDGPLPDAGVRLLMLDEWRKLHCRNGGGR
ncbi:glycosyltransferase [uncultured Desulfovibrio sp.]|uniref:CgeB family protein n=1 Tax=uncultured Desulfovibrio sp. TaxID=167968 RepID=UPI00261C56E1|nr:glycosyltransferase [uncultured Desulfovibrio sp.]